ncbi:hypothetical protein TNCV_576571 [Trichonephila clavipes]|nr:hypothetical protein TNCV_576571 [Trichonephila clavipes]
MVSGATENIKVPCKVKFWTPSRILRTRHHSGFGTPRVLGLPNGAGRYVTPLAMVVLMVTKSRPAIVELCARIPMPLNTSPLEGLIHVKSVMAQSPFVDETLRPRGKIERHVILD